MASPDDALGEPEYHRKEKASDVENRTGSYES